VLWHEFVLAYIYHECVWRAGEAAVTRYYRLILTGDI